MDRDSFIKMMNGAKLHDLTQGCSVFTPPWPGEKSLEVHFFKRVTGAYGGGQGANGLEHLRAGTEGVFVEVETQMSTPSLKRCHVGMESFNRGLRTHGPG